MPAMPQLNVVTPTVHTRKFQNVSDSKFREKNFLKNFHKIQILSQKFQSL